MKLTKTARIVLALPYLLFQMLVLLPIAMLYSLSFECGEVLRKTVKFLEEKR
jgi:hypothetical protein